MNSTSSADFKGQRFSKTAVPNFKHLTIFRCLLRVNNPFYVGLIGFLAAFFGFSPVAASGQVIYPGECQHSPPAIYYENYCTEGTQDWQIDSSNAAFNHEIEGYASATSVNVGEEIVFHVSVEDDQSFDIDIYRMGWYNGDGGRLVDSIRGLAGREQTYAEADRTTGLIEYDWDAPNDDYIWTPPEGTVSGFFIAKLTGSSGGKQSYIIFVVRDDERESDFLFQSAVTTYQAYNFFPRNFTDPDDWRSGKSLYGGGLSFGPEIPEGTNASGKQARAVSFNRPYYPDNPQTSGIYNSAGQFFEWEYNMVRWLEKESYDVTYQTDVDTHANANTIAPGQHKVLLSVGHDEYWSWDMRNNVEQARNRTNQPISIGFFGANISHWQIRFDTSGTYTKPGNAPNRTIIAYKSLANNQNSALADPLYTDTIATNNYLITGLWRDNESFGTQCPSNPSNCYKEPEDELVGVMTNISNPKGTGTFQFDSNCPSWVKAGMSNSQATFAGLLGYETDVIFYLSNYSDRTWSPVGKSYFTGNGSPDPPDSQAVYYKITASGARVFAAGTIQWAWGLDEFAANSLYGPVWHANLHDSEIEIVTHNILTCLRDGGTACT